mmetsp:Transcript_103216/g.301041  ORF Transcript_103216/g.301041 Transcript_103216/m.301041 type:complete len:325 (-) Transcript_103216:691-1665(-)
MRERPSPEAQTSAVRMCSQPTTRSRGSSRRAAPRANRSSIGAGAPASMQNGRAPGCAKGAGHLRGPPHRRSQLRAGASPLRLPHLQQVLVLQPGVLRGVPGRERLAAVGEMGPVRAEAQAVAGHGHEDAEPRGLRELELHLRALRVPDLEAHGAPQRRRLLGPRALLGLSPRPLARQAPLLLGPAARLLVGGALRLLHGALGVALLGAALGLLRGLPVLLALELQARARRLLLRGGPLRLLGGPPPRLLLGPLAGLLRLLPGLLLGSLPPHVLRQARLLLGGPLGGQLGVPPRLELLLPLRLQPGRLLGLRGLPPRQQGSLLRP